MKPISASAMKDAKGCLRKWAATRLCGYSEPPGDAAKAGTELHSYAEEYLETGKLPPQTSKMGRLLTNGLHLLPKPGTMPIVEHRFDFEWEGLAFCGYVDFGSIGLRADHKTSSDPTKWGLTEETLPSDGQALLYALTDALAFRGETEIRWSKGEGEKAEHFTSADLWGCEATELQWVYYPTRGAARPFVVEAELSADETVQRFGDLWLPVAREMAEVEGFFAEKPTAAELNMLPNDPSYCDGYGRWCPFRHECEMHPQVEKGIDVTMASLKEKIAAAKAARMATEAAAPAESTREELDAQKAEGANAAPPEAAAALDTVAAEIDGTLPTDPPKESDADAEPPAAAAPKGRKKVAKRKAGKAPTEPAADPDADLPPVPEAGGDAAAVRLVAAVREISALANDCGFVAEVRLK